MIQMNIVRRGHIIFWPSNYWYTYGHPTMIPRTCVPTALTTMNLVEHVVCNREARWNRSNYTIIILYSSTTKNYMGTMYNTHSFSRYNDPKSNSPENRYHKKKFFFIVQYTNESSDYGLLYISEESSSSRSYLIYKVSIYHQSCANDTIYCFI